MSQLSQILPIVLKYHEKGWTERTVKCLLDAGFSQEDIVFADRDGVGNMSRAFNAAIHLLKTEDDLEYIQFRGEYKTRMMGVKYIWFLTNVEFSPEMPLSLLSAFDSETAAVHPAFDSQHHFIANTVGIAPEVPFIEWTAPMVRADVFYELGGLDENLQYWGMDLAFSKAAKDKGYVLKVDGRYRLKHTYLHLHGTPESITRIRKQLRELYDKPTEDYLIGKYGENWLSLLWESHHYNSMNRKKIHI